MRLTKAFVRAIAMGTVALPVALANPSALRSCGGGPQLNSPGSVPSDKKLPSAQRSDEPLPGLDDDRDPLENEPLPGLDDDKATSAPAPVETASEESEANGKPHGFESVETDAAGATGNKKAKKVTLSQKIEYTRENYSDRGATTTRFQIPELHLAIDSDQATLVSAALGLIEQDKGGLDPDPHLLNAYEEIELFLLGLAFWSGVSPARVEEDIGALKNLRAKDPKRVALIRSIRQTVAALPTVEPIGGMQMGQPEPPASTTSPAPANPDSPSIPYYTPTFRSVQFDFRFDDAGQDEQAGGAVPRSSALPSVDLNDHGHMPKGLRSSEREGNSRSARNQAR